MMIGLFVLVTVVGKSQVSNSTNIGAIKSEQLTDEQLKKGIQKALEAGMTPAEIEAMARSRGMSSNEIQKLKARMEKLYGPNSGSDLKNNGTTQSTSKSGFNYKTIDYPDYFESRSKNGTPTIDERNFGFSLFTNNDLTFEPSTNIATPKNYQLGPDDGLNIDIWGASQANYEQTITGDGNIIIPNVGPIFLNGLTIEEATRKIKRELSKIYSGLAQGNTFVKVSLGTIRSIKINIVGEVTLPGTYNLSSLASVFNAMYAAGGPSSNGSLRSIKIIRGNKPVADLDFYDFLLKGEQSNNMRLQDQDVIYVAPYINRVEVTGQMKRNKLFDVKPNETLKDLLYFAGGFTSKAYTQQIKIFRKTGKENRLLDISFNQQAITKLQNGDSIHIDSILNRYENRVTIKGAVMRPGVYAIDSVSTLKQLIKKADGLREDVFKTRVSVFRLQSDFTREIIPIDLVQLMNSNLDFTLQREDSVNIPSISDLRERFTVTIEGEVEKPGTYPFAENSRVEDLVIQSGGLLETASMAHLEIARRIKDDKSVTTSNQLAQIFQFTISKDLKLSDSASMFVLQPFDQVFIRRSPSYMPQLLVSIEGEVTFPGRYSITSRTERISDLIKRAGNITPEAYLKGASLVRQLSSGQKLREKALETVANMNDSTKIGVLHRTLYNTIGIDLEKILNNPGSPNDLFLQQGDSLRILKQSQTVQVTGAVYNPNVIPFIDGMRLNRYISNAGGYTNDAVRSNVYVVYANGSVKKSTRYFIFRHHPRLEPGAEIMVPEKAAQKNRLSLAETMAISTALSSLALIVITIVNAVK
ncbi:MAG: SLBB domain-containing protein [Bacteroidetes bacterium]|nr:SLBB domain-containing protein [Bacteroidota bacterium]